MEELKEEHVKNKKKVVIIFIVKNSNSLEPYKFSPASLNEFALKEKLRTEMVYLLSVLVMLFQYITLVFLFLPQVNNISPLSIFVFSPFITPLSGFSTLSLDTFSSLPSLSTLP